MEFLRYEDIKDVHFELTNACNLKCPQCYRTRFPQKLSWIPEQRIKELFHVDFCKNLREVTFCGNTGEPTMAPNFLNILKWFKDNSHVKIMINTNGTVGEEVFWKNMSNILGKHDKVMFAIDGLEDTYSIYRIGGSFDTVIRNAQILIDNGISTRWDFIVFSHNEHQVEEAKKLAEKIGFKNFSEKLSVRFIKDDKNLTINKKYENIEISNLTKSVLEKVQNDIKSHHKTVDSYYDNTEIQCREKQGNRIFIDAQQKLWPCCWISPYRGYRKKLTEKYGEDFNSLESKSVQEVLDHIWFKKDLGESWTSNKRPQVCVSKCGKLFSFTQLNPALRKISNFKLVSKK